jgi:hypothetical protein
MEKFGDWVISPNRLLIVSDIPERYPKMLMHPYSSASYAAAAVIVLPGGLLSGKGDCFCICPLTVWMALLSATISGFWYFIVLTSFRIEIKNL